MAGNFDIGSLASWIVIILIGLGIKVLNQGGLIQQYGWLGDLFIFGGLILGVIYYAIDLSNKL